MNVRTVHANTYWLATDTYSTDLALSFIDWNPYAPDSSMGIWQKVELQVFFKDEQGQRQQQQQTFVALQFPNLQCYVAFTMKVFLVPVLVVAFEIVLLLPLAFCMST